MHTVMTFLVGFAVGLPTGGALMYAFGSRAKAKVEQIETVVTDFKGKVSGK